MPGPLRRDLAALISLALVVGSGCERRRQAADVGDGSVPGPAAEGVAADARSGVTPEERTMPPQRAGADPAEGTDDRAGTGAAAASDAPSLPTPGDEPPVVDEPPPDPLAEDRAREAAEREAFERAYPLYGVCYHFLAQIFAEPRAGARVVGYMRRGAQFRARSVGVRGRGCSGGWHVVPGDGYVCKGAGYQIGTGPQTFEPSPVPPALEDALPYAYAKTVRDDVPQYWALPTESQVLEAARAVAAIAAEEQRRAQASTPPSAVSVRGGVGRGGSDSGGSSSAGESFDAAGRADAVDAPPPPGQAAVTVDATPTPLDRLPDFLRMRMLSGFYVSLDREEEGPTGRFFRTVRGGYVRADQVVMATPPSMRGVVLGGDWRLPMAFVFRSGARRLEMDPVSGALVDRGTVARHTPMVVVRDDLVRGGKRYVVGDDGTVVREPAVRMVTPEPRPPVVRRGDRWIHVRLSTQTLVAYEGDVPVFATLVSTGKQGFSTPPGIYQIQSKHVSTTMDDDSSPDGAYSIEDVPWTMYFSGNLALHGAFWHNSFGQVRSHGCVNLAPADARWLFSWSTPVLPASWHGVFADRTRPGTWVVVTE
jgi:lipoprotein-anchoring transpeptidase ErfK/SrfK